VKYNYIEKQVGICIDHNAAFMIDRVNYRVFGPDCLQGSVLPDGSFSNDRFGKPGVWIKEVVMEDDDVVTCSLCPTSGELANLLKIPEQVMSSTRNLKLAAIKNPDNGPLRMSYPGFASKSFFGGKMTKEFLDALDEEIRNEENAGDEGTAKD
jgi:hypothetical protein